MRQKYYVCMDYGLDETGKRVKKYKTYPTLAQARRGLRDFQTEQDTHQTVAPRSMTLDQWLEYWMEEVIQPNRAATTIYGYRKIIDNHLSDALGSVPIQKLTPQHLQQYYSMLMRDKGLSANTVRRHHDLLSCALHMALRQDIILRCPTERVEPPRVIPHEARFYTPAELKRLFGLVEGHWLELIVKLAGSLGLRREEIWRPAVEQRGLRAAQAPHQGGPHRRRGGDRAEGDQEPLLQPHPPHERRSLPPAAAGARPAGRAQAGPGGRLAGHRHGGGGRQG